MKRITLLLLLTFSLSSLTAHADEASRRDKAKEMLVLTHADRLLKQMMDAIMQQTTSMSHRTIGQNIPSEQQAKVDQFQHKLIALIESQLSYASLEPDYIKIYADTFTDQELDGILAFYKSPVGQSLIDKMPALTTQAFKLSQSRMITLLPQIKQMIDDFAKDCPECKTHPAAPSPEPGN